MYPNLACYICFNTGKRNLKRKTPVQPVYNKLGHIRASAILSVMVKHDRTCLDGLQGELFIAYDDDILNALKSLDHRDLCQEGYNQFERFVCQLYTSKVNDFRWFLSPTTQLRGESSPNDWLTNNGYSMGTLRSNDLEKGWGKPSALSVSGRLWLGV